MAMYKVGDRVWIHGEYHAEIMSEWGTVWQVEEPEKIWVKPDSRPRPWLFRQPDIYDGEYSKTHGGFDLEVFDTEVECIRGRFYHTDRTGF